MTKNYSKNQILFHTRMQLWWSLYTLYLLFYNTTLLPSVNTLIARGMFCDARYTHHTLTPIIKHLITTTANKHPGKKSFIDKNMRKSHQHQAHKIKLPLPEDPLLNVTVLIKAIIRIIYNKLITAQHTAVPFIIHKTHRHL